MEERVIVLKVKIKELFLFKRDKKREVFKNLF